MIRHLALPLLLAMLAVACTDGSSGGPATGDAGGGEVVVGAAPSRPEVPPVGQSIVDPDGPPVDLERLPTASPTPGPVLREEPDAERAIRLATRLATDVGPRPSGSPADAVARITIASWLRQAGWQVDEQDVPLPQGGSTTNLVATLDGRGAAEAHVVVGAHHDTVAGSPGANDNASGIGVLVALADELADEAADLPVPVVLVAFGAEEVQPVDGRPHHLGSDLYMRRRGDDVVAMLSIDMVANGDETCICWFDVGPDTLARRLDALAGEEGFRVRTAGDVSDHGPFARAQIPAAFLWSGRDAGWHQPTDLPAALDVDDLRRSTRLAAAFIRSLTQDDRDGLVGP